MNIPIVPVQPTSADPLPDVPPQPTVDGFLPLEPWLERRLTQQTDHVDHAPYDFSLYGVINALLCTQFPLHRKFLVKPQAGLRVTHVDAVELGPKQANTSGETAGNSIPIFPDFIVARVLEEPNQDCTLCVIEVEREGTSFDRSETQIKEYLLRASSGNWRLGVLRGFLVFGSTVFAYRIDNTQQDPFPQRDEDWDLGATDGLAFKQALFSVARKYWGNWENGWWGNTFMGSHEIPLQ